MPNSKAYLKPPWFVVHVFNRIARLTGIGGSQTLTVTRSSNHLPQRIPVVVPEVDGVKYLVSTRGESAWVKNVRENPVVALGKVNYLATEVPVADRAPIIAVYRPLAGKVVEGYWKELPDDADHPVFKLALQK
ncbi:nitroreductase family deazaflavin-dependent oxidoreductase [Mycolicibacterium aubagnense]|uniref:Nitroreductase family deazaflavin-dependent oxidoreductase n=1 Tax=Mycolicibacterium aubagnense TaxID=319707 RepID=A0ABN5YRU9_9MYCO|nr:nitroreductase family deazaflavin-dependent oxidoreductase [Mycolicibacterium aubagnense]TLH50842.1 nitroreductase family deazaflavin-dependent oxidoreductase [Mycolicibacterium aubagnense]WGI33742.1 nitroreductase family deazaflavin-dependent oxidoreductase [Mycolicibacterium aubagnense]BBX84500.1 hypothetical protein MAUB_23730 [Mycolicibacterium aubagnense]